MEIHVLKVSISEADLNALVLKHLPQDQPIENITVSVTPAGVLIKGVYPLFIDVKFETLWEVGVQEGRIALRLAHIKAMGVPANIFKSAVLKLLEDQARQEEALSLQGELFLVDLDKLSARLPIPLHMGSRTVTCAAGQIVVEVGQS